MGEQPSIIMNNCHQEPIFILLSFQETLTLLIRITVDIYTSTKTLNTMRLKKLYPFTLIICILFVFFTHSSAIAQQDPHFTQYMYFTQVINPGYIGSREDVNFGGLYRAQWVGIEGAPRTLTLIGSTPLSEKVGLGMSIVRDEIGPARQSYAHFDFSYKIDVTDD